MAFSLFDEKKMNSNDIVSYWIFCHDENDHLITEKEELEKLLNNFLAHIMPFTEEYIWNDQSFSLRVEMNDVDPNDEFFGK